VTKDKQKTGITASSVKRRSGVEVLEPVRWTAPVVFASPHSGRRYPSRFIEQSRLSARDLRRSEDAFVDEIFAMAPDFGAPLIKAHFPRAYVDANRNAYELDPAMFRTALPDHVITKSPRIAAGLGTVPKIVASGENIYDGKLTFEEARERIETHYQPYHRTLSGLVDEAVERFGGCLLIDCHSMPSFGTGGKRRKPAPVPDMVLGDCHGRSCAREVVAITENILEENGFHTVRNKPYAGGFTARHYGKPRGGVHVLQVEINRAIYMDEKKIARGPGLATLIGRMSRVIEVLAGIEPVLLGGDTRSLKAAE